MDTTTAPRTTPRRRAALLALALVILAGTAASLTMSAAAADAATYWSTGAVGSASIPRGVCNYYPVWGRLDASTNAPAIYARDYRSGGGNDAAWVRYRVFVVNSRGQTVQSSGYSGWAIAYDNRPAAFSGKTLMKNVPDDSRIVLRIEWWDSTRMLGALAHVVDQYNHFSGMVGPSGPMNACGKW